MGTEARGLAAGFFMISLLFPLYLLTEEDLLPGNMLPEGGRDVCTEWVWQAESPGDDFEQRL